MTTDDSQETPVTDTQQIETRGARLSDDGVYRYTLDRRWGSGDPVAFVMLNPSTADALVDDPTIRRCVGFAKAWGYGALHVVNLYALRATDPKELWRHPEPTGGVANDEALRGALGTAAFVVAAWGANAKPDRVRFFDRAATYAGRTVFALRVTKVGAPGHPLYLPASSEPMRYAGVAR